MEDVLEVYHRKFQDNEVLVCLDETRKPLPPRPGAARAYDYEYQRNGVSNLFMLFAPLEGWRRVEVTERRTKVDWARVVRKLVDEDYADRERIVLVMDNLNTHHPSSLYEEFEPAEARRIAERLEIHYTPKHGSWLNMAEIELVLAGHLQGDFHRLGAASAEEGAGQVAGGQVGQLLGEQDSWNAAVGAGVGVRQGGHLFGHCLGDLWTAMPYVLQEQPGHGVNVPVPLDVVNVAPVAPDHDIVAAGSHQVGHLVVLGPEMVQTPLDKLVDFFP